MTNLTRFRPAGDDDEWADNALSNSMAWASTTLLPGWCSSPEHWAARLTGYLWTDCPCCLLWRGLALGFAAGAAAAAAAVAVLGLAA